MSERLQKVLAAAGIGSRRTCEEWIKAGRVRVDGVVVTELGTKVDLATQKVIFDSRVIQAPKKRYYIALNKPVGVVCTLVDRHAARVVTDLVDIQGKPMLRPVGRLDADTEGLIFLTDDGDFLYRMTHPKHHVPKTYRATVRGIPDSEAMIRLAKGVRLEDGMTAPAQVRLRSSSRGQARKTEAAEPGVVSEEGRSEVELTLTEGRNRQVRRMLMAVGHPVIRLQRVAIGTVRLTGLPVGCWRHLTQNEIAALTEQSQPSNNHPSIQKQENHSSWHAPQPSTPPKGSSLPNSRKRTPPAPRPTSSRWPKKASTTA